MFAKRGRCVIPIIKLIIDNKQYNASKNTKYKQTTDSPLHDLI